MVKAEDIGWGSYLEYEGPLYWGTQKFSLPAYPAQNDYLMAIVSATEGGTYDAYNGYDKCICTSGLIQWCDRAPWFLVCNLLGAVAEADLMLVCSVVEQATSVGFTFGKTAINQWRFWDSAGIVVTNVLQQQVLYFGGSNGLKGQWDEKQKLVAKKWAAAISNVWHSEAARKIQAYYTTGRLRSFVTEPGRKVLAQVRPDSNIGCAFEAAYLSFAANNPKKAGEAVANLVAAEGIQWTNDWLVKALHHLTFDPGIAIYPKRYDKIRPLLENFYGVDLPDFSQELEGWFSRNSFKGKLETKELQRALSVLGYDLGPRGMDGVFGRKTQAALHLFERDQVMPAEFRDGMPDRYTIPKLEVALAEKGDKLQWSAS